MLRGADPLRRVSEEFHASAASLRNYALRLGADPTAADDAVAEAFATVLAFERERLTAIENLRAYLFTTTRHLVRRGQTAASRTVAAPDEFLDTEVPDIGDAIAARSSLDLCSRALDALDETQRAVLIGILVEDRTPAEVGGVLGLSKSNVSTVLHRARGALRYGYTRAYLEQTPPPCGTDVGLLARVVTGRASKRDVAAYRRHAATCESCPRLERSAREELRAGSLLALFLLVLSVGGELARPDIALALAAPSTGDRSRSMLLGAGSGLVAVGLLPLALLPLSAAPGTQGGPILRVGTPSVRIDADPASIHVSMPLPGEDTTWSSRVTSASTVEITVYAELLPVQTSGTEDPALQLRRDGLALGSPIRLHGAPASVAMGTLAPGESLTIDGTVSRDAADTDQSLSAAATVRFWASSDISATPPSNEQSAEQPSPQLPATGSDPRLVILAGGTALTGLTGIGLGVGLIALSRRRAQPPEAGGV